MACRSRSLYTSNIHKFLYTSKFYCDSKVDWVVIVISSALFSAFHLKFKLINIKCILQLIDTYQFDCIYVCTLFILHNLSNAYAYSVSEQSGSISSR